MPRQQTVFHQDRVPGVPGRWALGLWLTYRKLVTSAYVPGQKYRSLLSGQQPYWFVLGFPNGNFLPMAPNSNQDDRVTCVNDFIMFAMMGAAVDLVGVQNFDFSAQLYDSGADENWTEALSPCANNFGTAQHPLILRRTHTIKAGTPIIARFQNSHAVNNNMPQIVLFGVLAPAAP